VEEEHKLVWNDDPMRKRRRRRRRRGRRRSRQGSEQMTRGCGGSGGG